MFNQSVNLSALKQELRETRESLKSALARGAPTSAGERVTALADRILAENPRDPDAILAKALMLIVGPLLDSSNAVTLVDTLSQEDLTTDQLIDAGGIMSLADSPRRAECILRAALQREPDSYEALYSLANLYGEAGVNVTASESRDLLQKAIDLKPESWKAIAAMGNLMKHNGDLDGARQMFERALTRVSADEPALRQKLLDAMNRL